jgi:hypothetical protein
MRTGLMGCARRPSRGATHASPPADRPMQLTVVGKEREAGKPASGFDHNRVPKGRCDE